MVTKFNKSAATAVLLTLANLAQGAYWSPHIGVDYKYWGVRSGDNDQWPAATSLFPNIDHGFNVYIGTRINGNWGIDIGYERSEKKEGETVFDGSKLIFSTPGASGDQARVTNQLRAWHLDGSFNWEVVDALELVFMGGVAYLTPYTAIEYFTTGSNLFTVEKVKSKWVGRLGFGLQYNPVPCIGLRALVHFDGTQRLEYIGNNVDSTPYDIRPYKSATSYYVGALYSFSKPRR